MGMVRPCYFRARKAVILGDLSCPRSRTKAAPSRLHFQLISSVKTTTIVVKPSWFGDLGECGLGAIVRVL